MASALENTSLHAQLASALGVEQVTTGEAARAFMSNDVYRAGGLPLAVIRPADVASVQTAVGLCTAAGVAMVPRGGGASYTDGYLYQPGGHVLFDLGALDSIAIDEPNAVVTVGAGTTWAALKSALDARGLRTPFIGPFSGIAATVGGSMSQNTLSHGSGVHGISAQSALSMQVVLASGELLDTSASQATRFYGPDLTGLFTGDCGALGLKVAIRLPLLRAHPHFEALSFAFDSFAAYHTAMRASQMERLDDTHFVLDRALSQGQIGRQEGLKARLAIAASIMRNAPRKLVGLRQLIRMGLAGEDPMRSGEYMCHFIVEGFDPADAAGKARRLRAVVGIHGREIINSMPTFVRAMPFAPLFNILGPGGERWVPIHGIFAHTDIMPFHTALQSLLAERRAEMERQGVWLGTMFSGVGSSGLLYELALYWPDDRSPFHRSMLGDEYLAAQPQFADNPPARAYADDLKRAIIALMQDHNAGHFQIGRAYPYQSRLSTAAKALLRAIKAELDPANLMNPGALGF
jgi:D-lactate dehydrogenase (cytochrome)